MKNVLTWLPPSGVVACVFGALIAYFLWFEQFGRDYYVSLKKAKMRVFLNDLGVENPSIKEKLLSFFVDVLENALPRSQDSEQRAFKKKIKDAEAVICEILKAPSTPEPTPQDQSRAVAKLIGTSSLPEPTALIKARVEEEFQAFKMSWHDLASDELLPKYELITHFVKAPTLFEWLSFMRENRKDFTDWRTLTPLLRDWIDYIGRAGMLGLLLGITIVSFMDPSDLFNQTTALISFAGAVLGSLVFSLRILTAATKKWFYSLALLLFIVIQTFIGGWWLLGK